MSVNINLREKENKKTNLTYPFGKYAQEHLLGCILQAVSELLASFLRLIQKESFLMFLNVLTLTEYNLTSRVHTYFSTEDTMALEDICCPEAGFQNLARAEFA